MDPIRSLEGASGAAAADISPESIHRRRPVGEGRRSAAEKMSKKKSGSTMTLKDFHGGSIPSDLPLPSAPGVVVRPTDRPGFDRPNPSPWGSPVGRSDHRSRPSSSGASRHFDDKAALLSQPPHIGRNFDEDERKPLDGSSAPRRTISDDAISSAWSLPFRGSDANSDAAKFHGRPLTSPLPMEKPALLSSQVARSNMGAQAASASAPNVWATRKEVPAFEAPSSWSGPNAVAKFAQASALEKIQSGRWQSKPMAYTQVADVEVIRHSETEDEAIRKGKSFDTYDYSQVHQIADSNDMYGLRKGFQSHEKGVHLMSDNLDVRPRSADNNQNYTSSFQVQPPFSSPLPEEMSERPKLKLLPRTKPLEKSELQAQELNKLFSSEHGWNHVEIASDIVDNLNSLRMGSAGEGVSHAAERPKLNLKPRSQAIEQVDGSVESGRNTLFGGARPRELVLKERGVEPTMGDNLDKSGQPPSRSPQEAFRPDQKQNLGAAALRYGEKGEVLPPDQKNPRELDRKDYRPDVQRADLQRNTWRTENMKSNRDLNKPQQEQRRPEQENWRKPVEPPKPDLPGKAAPRQGRIATALELAQAFSTPASDVKTADRFGNQRKEIPFSRLTDSKDFHSGAPQRRINGY